VHRTHGEGAGLLRTWRGKPERTCQRRHGPARGGACPGRSVVQGGVGPEPSGGRLGLGTPRPTASTSRYGGDAGHCPDSCAAVGVGP
jgi:hypothetical protein